jgi:thioester reductase-like protein
MLSTLNLDYGFTNKDKFLHQSSMSFDLSIVQIYSALTAGATVCVAAWETRKDPYALAEFMMEDEITVTYFTPTQFSLLLEHNNEALQRCNAYRVAYFAGERLPVRVAKAFYDLGTPATLYNTWSPSELVVQTSISRIAYPNASEVSLPIGYPMANCRHYILDARGNPLPAGFIGELVVGGSQVGAGYLHRPKENLKSFVENPFASEEDKERGWTRMFKTGDRGRFRADTQLEFHGRIAGDKQIKLRGFRVDLGEVEQRIFQESQSMKKGLIDIAVVARIAEPNQEDLQLIAYLVPKTKLSLEEKTSFVSNIHAKVKPHLNSYMLPNGYHFLAKLPTTIGGKVDRRNLLNRSLDLVYPSTTSLSQPKADTNGDANSNTTTLEDTVLGLFRGILGSDKYEELTDNFFEKGGHSILLVRLQAKIRKQFKVTPTLPQLIKEPTAASVCAYIRRTKGDNGGANGGFENSISWAAETKLPNDGRYIPQYGIPRIDRDEVKRFLITGGESFIGLHLLAEILSTRKDAAVYLLGSLSNIESTAVISELYKYGLINENLSEKDVVSRIVCLQGSLSKPSFGLTKSAFKELGRAVEVIYHLGGHVSLLKTYTFLKPVNVLPIFDLIRLSGIGDHLSEIHYLSTWSVAHLQSWTTSKRTRPDYVTTEEDMSHFTPPIDDEYGYFKTRWVAENILYQAAARGFPITVTRASAVTGSSHNGTLDPGDEFTLRMILSMVETGMVPQIGSASQPSFAVDVVPVDYLASGFFALTSEKSALTSLVSTKPHIYHINNPKPLKLKDLPEMVAKLRADGQRAQSVTLDQWLSAMESMGGGDDAAGAVVRTTVLKEYLSTGHVMFSLDSSKTATLLDTLVPGFEKRCPPVDAEFLGMLWRRIKKAEFHARS